jgi:hypothetical protein
MTERDIQLKMLRKIFPECSDQDFEGFSLDGLTDSEVVANLEISWAELHRWNEDGRFPKPDVQVLQWVWRSSGKYKVLCLENGWSAFALVAAKLNIEAWRDEHIKNRIAIEKERRRARKQQQKENA